MNQDNLPKPLGDSTQFSGCLAGYVAPPLPKRAKRKSAPVKMARPAASPSTLPAMAGCRVRGPGGSRWSLEHPEFAHVLNFEAHTHTWINMKTWGFGRLFSALGHNFSETCGNLNSASDSSNLYFWFRWCIVFRGYLMSQLLWDFEHHPGVVTGDDLNRKPCLTPGG